MTRWLLSTVLVTVGCVDKPPGAPTLTISPKSPTSVDDLVATVSGRNNATVVYRWYRDHGLQDDLTEDTVSAEHTARGEIWTAIVAVEVDGVEGIPVGGDVEIGNAAPSVTVSMAETVETGGTITPHVVVSDPDDPRDTVTLSYLWANDANVDTFDTKSITIPSETGLATVWTLTTTPTDPQGLAGTPTDTSTTVVYGDPAQPVGWIIEVDESCAGDISATHHDREYTGGKETMGAAIVDLNGDDWLDMIWFNQLDENALIYINEGPDTDHTILDISVGRPSGKGAFGDVNADGLIDMVVSNRGWTDEDLGTLSIVKGDDTIEDLFSAPITISEPARPNSLVLLDVDGDDALDLLMDQDDDDEERCVSLRWGANNASFDEAECVIDQRWHSITAFDPDGDGQSGLVGYGIVGGQSGAHYFEIDNGTVSDPKYIELPDLFADISQYDPANVRGFDVTDVNLDGLDDLLIWFESGSAGLQLVQLTNEGDLRFTACELASDIPHAIYAAGDLNKDGVTDVLASTLVAFETSTYHVYLSHDGDTGTDDTGEPPAPSCTALGFDGDDDHVNSRENLEALVAGGDDDDDASGFTVEAWFRTESRPDGDDHFRIVGTSYSLIGLEMDSEGQLKGYRSPFTRDDSADCTTVTVDGYDDGKWHHMALSSRIVEGDYFRVHVDGKQICEREVMLTMEAVEGSGNQYIILGANTDRYDWDSTITTVYDDHFDGAIAGFRFNNTAVYSEDDFTPPYPLTAIDGTRVLYNFDEAVSSGTDAARDAAEVIDSSGYEHDAAVFGEANWLDGFEECPEVMSASACLGTSDACPATSCREILEAGVSTGDGIYWLDPLDTGPLRAYCDMTHDDGGWTRVIYAAIAPGASAIYTEFAYNRPGCTLGEDLCKLSDDEINALLDAHAGTDDRFRLTHGTDPAGHHFWDTTTPFRFSNADTTSSWWKVARSLGGGHTPGCRHSSARGVGHYEGGATGCDGFDFENQFYHVGLEYAGSPDAARANFSWWVR